MKKLSVILLSAVLATMFWIGSSHAKVIKIGAIFPFTGQLANFGDDARKTLEMAQEEINTAGGIKGDEVKFIYEDSGGTPKGGVSAAQKLIEVDKADVLIGDLFSAVVLAMKPIITSNKVVLIAPMGSNPNLFTGTKYLFSLSSTDNDYCFLTSKYLIQEKKKKTVGNLYMMTDSGVDSDRLMAKWWEHFGGKVLIRESFQPGSTDFRTQLTKIRAANPEVLFLSITWREGANILKQLAEMGLKMLVACNSQIKEPKLFELVGDEAEGVIYAEPYAGFGDEDKKLREGFEKKFADRYKRGPGVVAYRTYDSAMVAFEGLKRGGTKGDSLRDAIAKLDLPGVDGHIQFKEDGSPTKGAAMWIIQDRKFVELNYVGYAP